MDIDAVPPQSHVAAATDARPNGRAVGDDSTSRSTRATTTRSARSRTSRCRTSSGTEERRFAESASPTITTTFTLSCGRCTATSRRRLRRTRSSSAPRRRTAQNRSSAAVLRRDYARGRLRARPRATRSRRDAPRSVGSTRPFESASLDSAVQRALGARRRQCTPNNWARTNDWPPTRQIPRGDPRLITVLLTSLARRSTSRPGAGTPITGVGRVLRHRLGRAPASCSDDTRRARQRRRSRAATADYGGAVAVWGHFVKFVLPPSSGTPATHRARGSTHVHRRPGDRNDVEACIAPLGPLEGGQAQGL